MPTHVLQYKSVQGRLAPIITILQAGDGGFIPVYLHDLELQIGPKRFLAKVGFAERLIVAFNLIGRYSIFTRFKICFQEQEPMLSFET